MTKSLKTILAVIAVIIVALVVWYFGFRNKEAKAPAIPETTAVATTTPEVAAVPVIDNSDAGVEADITAIDVQLDALTSDSSVVDQTIANY